MFRFVFHSPILSNFEVAVEDSLYYFRVYWYCAWFNLFCFRCVNAPLYPCQVITIGWLVDQSIMLTFGTPTGVPYGPLSWAEVV